jgi:hypothetical protein
MSELTLTLAGVVAFALVHAAHPRRFPAGDRWWRQLERGFGAAPRTLHALAVVVLIAGGWGGARTFTAAEAALILAFAAMTAGSAMVLAVPLWPRWTWRICAGCALVLPLLLIAQVIHG